MHTRGTMRREIPYLLGAVLLAVAGIEQGYAQKKVTEKPATVTKVALTRPPVPPSARPKIATQKLMRNPWERETPGAASMTSRSGVSDDPEALPQFYW